MKIHRILSGALAACLTAALLAPQASAARDSVVITDAHTGIDVHEDGSADVTHELQLSFSEGDYDFSLDFSAAWSANGAQVSDVEVVGAPCTVDDYGSDGHMFNIAFDTASLAGSEAEVTISYRYETFDDLEPEYDVMVVPLFAFSRTADVRHLTAEITLPAALTPTDVRAVGSLYVADSASDAGLDAAVETDGNVIRVELREGLASWEDLCLAMEFAPGALGEREVAGRTGVRVTGSTCEVDVSTERVYSVRQSLTVEVDEDAEDWSVFLPLLETDESWDGGRYDAFAFVRNDGGAEFDESGQYIVFHLTDDEGLRRAGTFTFEYTYALTPRRVAAGETLYLPVVYGADTTENLTFTLRAPTLTGARTFFGGIRATPKSERFEITAQDGALTIRTKGVLYNEEYLNIVPEWDESAFSRSAPGAVWTGLALAAVLAAALGALALRRRVPRPAGVRSPEVPGGVTAAAAGYLCDGVVGRAELGAQIVSWAASGAASLRAAPDGGVVVTRTGDLSPDAPDWERGLFSECFGRAGAFSAAALSGAAREASHRALRGIRAQYGALPQSARPARLGVAAAVLIAFVSAAAARLVLGDGALPAFGAGLLCAAAALPMLVCAFAAAQPCFALAQSPGRRAVRAVFAVLALGLAALPALLMSMLGAPGAGAYALSAALCACAALAARTGAAAPETRAALAGLDGLGKFLAAASPAEIEALLREDENAFYRLLPYAVSMGLYEPWIARFAGMYVRVNTSFEGAENYEDAARLAARTVLAARGR